MEGTMKHRSGTTYDDDLELNRLCNRTTAVAGVKRGRRRVQLQDAARIERGESRSVVVEVISTTHTSVRSGEMTAAHHCRRTNEYASKAIDTSVEAMSLHGYRFETLGHARCFMLRS